MHGWFRFAAALFASAFLVALAPGPAQAAATTYVALGDSYSSGTGTRTYINDGTSCQRSVYAYPSLIAVSKGYSLNFRACSGATVDDVLNLQLGAVVTGTAYVSITVGGNDAGFAAVLTECAKPAWASNCNAAIDRAQSIINQLPGRLRTLYAAVRAKSPKVVAAGYPLIFNGEDCNLLTWFSPTEEARLNATATLLNEKVKAAALAEGVAYVDPTTTFDNHAVCDSPEWINGLSSPTSESFHPNRAGHASGYSLLVASALSQSTLPVAPLSTQQAAVQSQRLAAQQRAYATQDRTIRPKTFKIPNLQSREIKAAAVRAGVNLESRASIDAADARYAAKQAGSY